MTRKATTQSPNVMPDTPSRGVAHGLAMRVTRQSPTPQRGRGNGVIRAWAIARTQHTSHALADGDEATPLAVLGGLFLWLLRLALAPLSTVSGFRHWVLEECPVAPGRKAATPIPLTTRRRRRLKAARRQNDRTSPDPKPPGKQARMISLAAQRHDLSTLPLGQVSGIANTIGAEVDLSPGTARRVLLNHVRALQNGHPQKETTP